MSDLAAANPRELGRVLKELSGASAQDLAPTLALPTFEVVASASRQQLDCLLATLARTGASVLPTNRFVAEPERSLEWIGRRWMLAKLALATAIGGAGFLVDSRLALGLALGAALAALLHSVQLVPRAVELPAEIVDRRLSVLDAEMRSRARSLSKELTDPVARATARDLIESIAELRWTLRAEGAHLSQPELSTVDDELRALARSCLRLAGLATGSVSGAVDPSTEALLERLRAVPAQLTAMTASLKRLRGSTIEKQELALLRVTLGEAQVAIEAAHECSLIA